MKYILFLYLSMTFWPTYAFDYEFEAKQQRIIADLALVQKGGIQNYDNVIKDLDEFIMYYEVFKSKNKDIENPDYQSLLHAYDYEVQKFKAQVESFLSVHVKRKSLVKAFVNQYNTVLLEDKSSKKMIGFYHLFMQKILYDQSLEKEELEKILLDLREDIVKNNPEFVGKFIQYSKTINQLNIYQTQFLDLARYFSRFSNGELHEKIREYNKSNTHKKYAVFSFVVIISLVILFLILLRLNRRSNHYNHNDSEEDIPDLPKNINPTMGNEVVEVISSIAFRIKSPMNGILGMTEILKSTDLDSKQDNYVDAIVDSSEKLQLIMSDAVEYLLLKNDKLGINETTVSPSKLFTDINEKFYPEFEKKGLNSILEIDPNIPENIKIDEKLLDRVISNLYKNALKFTLQGEVLNRIKFTEIKNDLGELEIVFSDTGIGIEKEHLDSIFKAKLLSSASREDYQKSETGLGLPITKMICEKMGGRIKAESEIGRGTTFTITLKCEAVKKVESNTQSIIKKTGTLNILVAEDERIIQKVIKTYLSSAGHNVDIANNGKEALDKALENDFDIVFMDMIMPEMDGVTASQKINHSLKDNAPIIVALTANDSVEDRKRCREAGMRDFLTKPVKKNKILELITRIFH